MTPTLNDDLLDVCDRVLERVTKAEPSAEATVSASRGPEALTRFANSFVHQNVAEDDESIALRVIIDGRSATASTTRTEPDAIDALVTRTIAAARLRPVDPDWPGLTPPSTPPLDPAGDPYDEATANATPDERAAAVRAFVDGGAAGAGETTAAGFVSTKGKHAAFANTEGQRLIGRTTAAVLDGIHRSPGGDGSGRCAANAIGRLDAAAAGDRAAAKARAQRDADDLVDLPPGPYEVVLEPGCLANMLMFLCGLGFNAKPYADGTSFVHLGEQQFDESIDIWDDASDPRSVGFRYDAEGTFRSRLTLVERGVTTAVATDRRTAARLGNGAQSTGHGTVDESSGGVAVNVFLGGGDRTPDELIGGVERGLLVTDFHYTRILDPKTQVVTGLTRNGLFLIEGGKVTSPVRNLRFTQSYVAALGPGKVLGIGSDAQLVAGSQLGSATHVPSVHLAAWNFTGGARG